MFLAEDRIMCFKIITQKIAKGSLPNGKKRPNAYKLFYLPGAWATTDPPDNFGLLIAQRRRWINGSNMIFFYILRNACSLLCTRHSILQKLFLLINLLVTIAQ